VRLAFQVAYFGTDFYGSQVQPGLRTVEGDMVQACIRLGLFTDWREAGFALSGRTDRGVHARGQICAFTTSQPERAVTKLNAVLPPDCWCRGWAKAGAAFHPRYDALHRTYRYYLHDRRLDEDLLAGAAACFPGTHDFSCFARLEGKHPVRTIHTARIIPDEDVWVLEIRGESFLWNMVRCIATALIAAGRGEMAAAEIRSLLATGTGRHLPPAPPDALVLWDIDCGLGFSPVDMGARRRDAIAEQRRRYASLKKVTDCIPFPEGAEDRGDEHARHPAG